MRIHITGNAGSGKTTLAQRVGAALDLPVFHLDQVVWQPGWQKTPPAIRNKSEAELIAQPDWVIEGVSHNVRRAADVTVFLDVPRHLCLFRAVRRNLPYLFRSRPELPPDCPEIMIFPQLVKIIWRFPALVRPVLLDAMRRGENFITVSVGRRFDPGELEPFEVVHDATRATQPEANPNDLTGARA